MTPNLEVTDDLSLAEDQKPLTKREREWAAKVADLLAHKPERLALVSFQDGLVLVDAATPYSEDLSFLDEAYVLARFDARAFGTVD